MIDLTDVDQHRAMHAARVDRVNREGWMRQEQVSTPPAASRLLQRAGAMLIRLGAWIGLMPFGFARTTVR